jgi:endonuclease YncB( thermonuclease family)
MRITAVALGLLLSFPALAADVTGVPRIVDGDTIAIGETKIRLEGIDAPETDQLCFDAKGGRWTCGIAARGKLEKYAGGKPWTCHVHGQDRYGRSLATCEVNGEDIDRWMVREGWALSFVRYSHVYDADEKAARERKAGLWAGCFIAPWEWRARNEKTVLLGSVCPVNAQKDLLRPKSSLEAPSPGCTIKGNMNRAGECIYHLPGGRSYPTIKMDKRKRWFCTEAEAEAAGCRKALQ